MMTASGLLFWATLYNHKFGENLNIFLNFTTIAGSLP